MVPSHRISVFAASLNRSLLGALMSTVTSASRSQILLRLSESSAISLNEALKPISVVSLLGRHLVFLIFHGTRTEPIAVGVASRGGVALPIEEATPLTYTRWIFERVSSCPVDSWRPCADWFPSSSTTSRLLLGRRTPELMYLRSRLRILFTGRLRC